MKLHHREAIVREAEGKLRDCIMGLLRDDNLTEGEFLHVVGHILGDQIMTTAKYMIREERHGRTDIPGGLEADRG